MYVQKETIDNIIKDKDFLKKIINLSSTEEVKKAFKEKGLNLSTKDVENLGKKVTSQITHFKEVPEDMLKAITGGLSSEKSVHLSEITKNLAIASVCIALSIVVTVNGINMNKLLNNADDTFKKVGEAADEMKGTANRANRAADSAANAASYVNPLSWINWFSGSK